MKAVTAAAASRSTNRSSLWLHRRTLRVSTCSSSATAERPQSRGNSDQRQRSFASSSSSSSAFWDDFVPQALSAEAVRSKVKAAVLDEVVRDGSSLWRRPTGGNRPHHRVNGHTADAEDLDGSSRPVKDDYGGGVDDSLSDYEDPLLDLYLRHPTRYWPYVPDGVDATADPTALAQSELDQLSASIRDDLIGTDHPVLNRAASYFFQSAADGGKKVRPMMVVLLSRALAETANSHEGVAVAEYASEDGHLVRSVFSAPLPWQRPDLPRAQRRLAEISELIHTASLFHDDVIDGSDTRRNVPAVHVAFGNKTAILAGDYLLARASICLARLRDVRVVETMSTIIEHLVRGEVMQLRGSSSGGAAEQEAAATDDDRRIVYYLRKNFYKTASLMANSCKSAALLGHYSPELVRASYRYGKHVGMAFQLVDDVLDFQGSLLSLGKPALADLRAGLATAPVLFAAEECGNDLWPLIERKFERDGDVDKAVELVFASRGIERTQHLARVHAEAAMDAALENLAPSEHRDALVHLAHKVVARTK